jgi:hypothetical protein
VLDAAAGMKWMPGATELRTDDYRLIRYPDVSLDLAFRAAQVTWSRTERPLDEIIEEIAAYARGWGVPGVAWWVSAATWPAGTEEILRARDAELIDAVQVLAREVPPPWCKWRIGGSAGRPWSGRCAASSSPPCAAAM